MTLRLIIVIVGCLLYPLQGTCMDAYEGMQGRNRVEDDIYMVVAERNAVHKAMAASMVGNAGLNYGDVDKLLLSDGTYAAVSSVFRWVRQKRVKGGFYLQTENGVWLIPAVGSKKNAGVQLKAENHADAYWEESDGKVLGYRYPGDDPRLLVYSKAGGGVFTTVPESEVTPEHWTHLTLGVLAPPPDSAFTADGVKTLYGGWSATKLSRISWKNVGALDLTKIALPQQSKSFEYRPSVCNALVYVNREAVAWIPESWKNVVSVSKDGKGRAIRPIQWVDACPLTVPYRFYAGADSLSYERKFMGDGLWETLYLPFTVEGCPDGFELACYNQRGTDVFMKTTDIGAYTPLLIRNVRRLSQPKVVLKAMGGWVESSTDHVSLGVMRGTLTCLQVASADKTYILAPDGITFRRAAAGSYVNPFRCYFSKDVKTE